jgi:hypothetical protein
LGATIGAGGRGFQPQRRLHQRDFAVGYKKRLAAPQKTIYNREAKDGTRWPCNAFFHPQGLVFHFGWERRRIGPLMRGFVPANE